ncbi:sulfatase-like hydrolase/transferase [Pigmentiphaga daeguensis]|uniref:Sulfatase-like hydrolase/transferase n=1 Tax=Pigmentiphaga daeguensis TaxID=414049 RepID=A0ABN1C3W6_9BURK
MASNLLIILSDEHSPGVMGCAGHGEVSTPHLDALAASGTRFANAVCASPICVPTRAALATGRAVHEAGYWDNVDAYDGAVPSWHHVLREHGHEVVSIGKLHYRGAPGEDYGFSESLLPMHIHGGRGEVKMLLRDPPASLGDGANMLASARAGESDYNRYDDRICDTAVRWLRRKAATPAPDKPWVLMVSLVAPHFPLTVPAPFFDRYAAQPLRLPKAYRFGIDEAAHPFIRQYARETGYNVHFRDESDVRRALAGYYGLVSFLDAKVGTLVRTLKECGLDDATRIMYLSDHGDNVGARGLWGKSTMYAESVGIPMILSGAGIEAGRVERTPVGQTDVYDTVLDAVGVPADAGRVSPSARSLLRELPADRAVLSEYHTVGSRAAVFMLRDAHTKYVHYCDHPPQLFDLDDDPDELHDIAAKSPGRVRAWRERLAGFCDPDEVDRRAKARQAELIRRHGGDAAIRAGTGIGGYTPVSA